MIAESIIEEIKKLLDLYRCSYIKLFIVQENNSVKLTMYLISSYANFKLEKEFKLQIPESFELESEKIKDFLIELVTPRVISEYKLSGKILRSYKVEPEKLKGGVIYVFTLYPSGKKVYNALFINSKGGFLEVGVRLSGYVFS